MQGIQKVKCSSCGTMFMSEDNKTLCPSCQEQKVNIWAVAADAVIVINFFIILILIKINIVKDK